MSNSKPIKFVCHRLPMSAHDNQHKNYGIYIWFKRRGLYKQNEINKIIDEYLNDKDLKGISKIDYLDKNSTSFFSFASNKLTKKK